MERATEIGPPISVLYGYPDDRSLNQKHRDIKADLGGTGNMLL